MSMEQFIGAISDRYDEYIEEYGDENEDEDE